MDRFLTKSRTETRHQLRELFRQRETRLGLRPSQATTNPPSTLGHRRDLAKVASHHGDNTACFAEFDHSQDDSGRFFGGHDKVNEVGLEDTKPIAFGSIGFDNVTENAIRYHVNAVAFLALIALIFFFELKREHKTVRHRSLNIFALGLVYRSASENDQPGLRPCF